MCIFEYVYYMFVCFGFFLLYLIQHSALIYIQTSTCVNSIYYRYKDVYVLTSVYIFHDLLKRTKRGWAMIDGGGGVFFREFAHKELFQ